MFLVLLHGFNSLVYKYFAMPNKINISDIKTKLPSFVTIYEDTYKGARYKAKFRDIEYNEDFEAYVTNVIQLQHGCRARSNKRKSEADYKRLTLQEFKAILPSYLKIYDETWKSLRHKAKFHDIYYNVDFEMYCMNIERERRGFCKERQLAEFRNKVNIKANVIQERLDECYGKDLVQLIPESLKGTNKMASYLVEDRILICSPDLACKGGLFGYRNQLRGWKFQIRQIDNFCCAISGMKDKLCIHHIKSQKIYPEFQFNIKNGITLSQDLHIEFHQKYGYHNATKSQLLEFALSKGVDLSLRLANAPD